ncbi:uncharacterized protein Z520_07594 [Fonsecaea multimorphosa CBS 102226]|uniref:SAC3/GANP/THP3 conserved domain-containing protein n=1 Tax=Fonsecaea multimorphosa CBS 102226 TaxID=1442371 RepID=A0A0D2K1I2_9EURO|nr:uncharacterized protein Z520_07594 [Fonsecaea multimorphosa CBS 102226]KIX96874.1 hypothetical protein Z520_07594 [Fonsecaea multimorphosa CBS 102226]OAL22552.1 hypothetical protein AYO22_07110 [Fonsecaea multimorphosa]
MSAPPSTRGQRGGSSTRGGRGTPLQTIRGRGSTRGSTTVRGRGRGAGAGAGTNAGASNTNGEGLLQRLRAGTVKRGEGNGPSVSGRGRGGGAGNAAPFPAGSRGRGRGFANLSQTFNTPKSQTSKPGSRAASPAPASHRDFMNLAHNKFQTLKQSREEERTRAIRDGFLADPEKKTSLDKAITPVGTCTEMCPEFERVERIVQNMVDKAEKVRNEETGKDMPAEDRMVKRFRRSAAGYDEQLPSDIRTPETLKRTLDYLLDKVIGGGERLATVHKFVWDRTRGIRNDFSIQQVSNVQDVKLAVDCFERIARFHILSLHQLSNPDNLLEGENFDTYQEREQLNNTLLSLVYYYDDHRDRLDFPNEGEFRAYLVIFEIQAPERPDLEDRMQSWPRSLLRDKRVQTALKLYRAAGNSLLGQGPLQPWEPFAVAQGKTGSFWSLLASDAVPYIMACLAEIYFAEVRFAALDALWRSCKKGPQAQQAKSRDWTLSEVTNFLGFDSNDDTKDFCAAFDLYYATDDDSGEEYLDATANSAPSLDPSSIPRRQVFSHTYVERKRYRRTLTAVINGATVAEAIRQGWVEPEDEDARGPADDTRDDDQSMFVPETKPTTSAGSSVFGPSLNPQAAPFTPFGQSTPSSSLTKPTVFSGFGSSGSFNAAASVKPTIESPFGKPLTNAGFGSFEPSTLTDSTGTFAKSTLAQPQQTSTVGFAGFTPLATPSTPTFGLPAPAQKESKPFSWGGSTSDLREASTTSQDNELARPAFASTINSGNPTPAPSTSTTSSVTPLAPIFGQPPAPQPKISAASQAKQVNPPATAPSSTPSQFASLAPSSSSTSAIFGQTSGGTTPPSLFTSTEKPTAQPEAAQATSELERRAPSITTPAVSSVEPIPSPFFNPTTAGSSRTQSSSAIESVSKPSLEKFSFPTATTSTTTAKNKHPSQQPDKITVTPSPTPTEYPRRSTTPPHSPRQPPAKPVFTEVDRNKLAANVARIAFTQQKGLLNSYLDFTLRDLVTTAFNQHQLEARDASIASVRERILARKFGYLWRTRAWTSALNRRAKTRRQLFAETIRAEQARKQRTEEELEEILRATTETKRLQREVQQAVEAAKAPTAMQNKVEACNVAGRKRKSFSGANSTANGTSSVPAHKRSKTMSVSSDPSASAMSQRPPVPSFGASTSRPRQHVSIFSGTSTLRQSTSAQKLDTTRTDYFRLKAMGVDPETPFVPDTQQSLAIRRQKEAEERQASLKRANRRTRTSLSSDQSSPAPSLPPVVADSRTPGAKPTAHQTPILPPVEDDFLKQIREAREAMVEQIEWFKQQSVSLEKEIELDEEFRRSQSSRDHGSPSSASGLRRVNGYDFLPGANKPGSSLSRTERRIRETGAHGLATKPLRPSSQYVPVAMSKKTARDYSTGSNVSSPGRKRSHDDMNPVSNEKVTKRNSGNLPASKRPRAAPSKPMIQHSRPNRIARNQGSNSFDLLQSTPPDDQEEADDDTEGDGHQQDELYEEAEGSSSEPDPRQDIRNGTYEDDEDEEELEEDEEEENGYYLGQASRGGEREYEDEEEDIEEEEDHNDEDNDDLEEDDDGEEEDRQYSYPGYLHGTRQDESFDDAEAETPMTNPQLSRAASSAPGGSVDDALVLSDSD